MKQIVLVLVLSGCGSVPPVTEVTEVVEIRETETGLRAIDAEGSRVGAVVAIREGEFVTVLSSGYVFEVALTTGYVTAPAAIENRFDGPGCDTAGAATGCVAPALNLVRSIEPQWGKAEEDLLELGPRRELVLYRINPAGECVEIGSGCFASYVDSPLRSSWVAPIHLE